MKFPTKLLALVSLCGAVSVQALPQTECRGAGPEAGFSAEERAANRAENFMKMDLNQDGKVSRQEIGEFKAQRREARTGSRADRFERADADGDGLISAEEILAATQRRLAKQDIDGDGQLSAMEIHRGGRGLQRGGW